MYPADVVHGEPPSDVHLDRLASLFQRPRAWAGPRPKPDCLVFLELCGPPRATPPAQVSWRGHEDLLHHGKFACDQVRVREGPHADGHIKPFGDQVDVALGAHHLDSHVGVTLQKLRRDVAECSQRRWRGDPKESAGCYLHLLYGELGFVGLAADARTVLGVDTADVRETESARCSLNQARADTLLELTDFAADGRLRHRKMPRRGREAPSIGHGCEDDHRVQIRTLVVHCPVFGTVIPRSLL